VPALPAPFLRVSQQLVCLRLVSASASASFLGLAGGLSANTCRFYPVPGILKQNAHKAHESASTAAVAMLSAKAAAFGLWAMAWATVRVALA